MSSLTGQGGRGVSTATGANQGNKIPTGYSAGRIQQFDPQQMELYNQSFQHVGPNSYLGRLSRGDQSLFGEIEAPAMRQFQGLQGQLASRFSGGGGRGSLGARKSSGFMNAANQQTSDFAQDLASRRQEMQRQAIQDLMGFSHQILGERPYDNFLFPKQQNQQGGWGGAVSGAATGATAGSAFGPWGTAAGGVLGGAAGYFSSGNGGGGGYNG